MMNVPTGASGRRRVLVVGHHLEAQAPSDKRTDARGKSLSLIRVPWVEDAVDGIRTGTADAVAVIVGPPGEGLSELSSFRESAPLAPLLALLRDVDEDLLLAAIGAGADEVVRLGDHEAMATAVERALARSRARRPAAGGRGRRPVSLLGAATARIELAELIEPVLDVRAQLRALDEAQAQAGSTPILESWGRLRDSAVAALDRLEQAVSTSGAARPASARRRPRRTSGGEQRGRLLLVDDDPMVLYALTEVLSPRHEVIAAGSGAEALRILSEDGQFDAVVCDVVMPDIDGVGVLQFLQTHHPELAERLIFCTGGDFEPGTARVLAGGASPIVPKTSLRLLHETIRRVVWESSDLHGEP